MNPNDVKIAKEKIINLIKNKGPRLPVQIAREINSDLIFSGAFLSELLTDKILKLSHLKVGGSHLYMMSGQEAMLENFYTSLNHKEKEAYTLLKERGILSDEEQLPPIRVALRNIKDFAIPFRFDNKLYWRYLNFSEEQVRQRLEETPKIEKKYQEPEIKPEPIILVVPKIPEAKPHNKVEETQIIMQEVAPRDKELSVISNIPKEKPLDIFTKEEEMPKQKKERKPKVEFIEEVKSSLSGKGIEIINIEKTNKKEAMIHAKKDGKEFLILALNKKKISDKEFIKAYKKSLVYSLPYTIIIREDASKKLKENIDASKALLNIEKL